jgi:CDP-diacylglycerol--glycerol-3-phosphate 3-phosphatidyltransferase
LEGKQPFNLTDYLRVQSKGILTWLATHISRTGLYPNTITLIGLAGNTVGAVCLALGHMTIGGLIILAMGLLDALDGTLARLRNQTNAFGAFTDSVTDRYSELVVFAGLLVFYTLKGDWLSTTAIYLAAAGSVLVSYIRARGQSLGMDTKVGILTRFERYIVLAPSLVLNLPLVGIWITAVLANITALQRIIDVRRQWYQNHK